MKQTVRGMILGCTLAAALVLTGCMNSNSGANSTSQSHSTSGTASGSGASQTEDRSGWRTGMSVLTEMTEQDKNGKLNTITAAVVLDGEAVVAVYNNGDSPVSMELQLPVEAAGVKDLLAGCVGSQPILTQVEWGKLKVQLPSNYATLLQLV